MKLTENFSKQEFDSKDGAKMPEKVLKNVKILAEQLQIIRDYINEFYNLDSKALYINSAYRSPSHNKAIGGAHKFVKGKRVETSQHVLGKAGDLSHRDLKPEQLHYAILKLISDGKIKEGGVGLYNGFVHYDIRGTKARWNNRK